MATEKRRLVLYEEALRHGETILNISLKKDSSDWKESFRNVNVLHTIMVDVEMKEYVDSYTGSLRSTMNPPLDRMTIQPYSWFGSSEARQFEFPFGLVVVQNDDLTVSMFVKGQQIGSSYKYCTVLDSCHSPYFNDVLCSFRSRDGKKIERACVFKGEVYESNSSWKLAQFYEEKPEGGIAKSNVPVKILAKAKGITCLGSGAWVDNKILPYLFGKQGDERITPQYKKGYKGGERVIKSDSEFKFGLEIEREDLRAMKAIEDLEGRLPCNWEYESDSSLDEIIGMEVVTPAYDLFSDEFEEDVLKHPVLKTICDGKASSKCGGHINISQKGKTGLQLYHGISSWMPIMMMLNANRLSNRRNYSWTHKHSEINAQGRQGMIMCKERDPRLELRIWDAPKNFEEIMWRINFIRLCVTCQDVKPQNIAELMSKEGSKLNQLILQKTDNLAQFVSDYLTLSEIYLNGKYSKASNINNENLKKHVHSNCKHLTASK